jgi:peptide/nickel transport system substrate-binding protein
MYRKENRKSFAALAFLGSAMFGLVSCGSNSSTSEGGATSDDAIAEVGTLTYVKIDDAAEVDPTWSDENTVVYHFIGEPDDMHPTNGNSASKTFLHGYTQKYIMSSDIINLDARPDVVKDWPVISEDELSFTYELRDDPKWDDGAQLSMEDVIFTFMANKCPLTNNPHAKPYLENLEAIIIDAENPRKFTLKMKKKYIHNIFFLTDYPLLQEAFWDPSKTMRSYSFAQFDDSKFDTNSEAALNTWATEFNDANSQALEFKTQALDASTYLSTKKMMELQDDQNFNNNYHSRFTNTYNYSYLGFNCRPDGIEHKKFFDDKRVRRAIAMLISVDEMNVVLNKGKNKRMVGPVSPLKKEYNTDLSLIDRDLEGAKALLEEAGWTDTDGDNIVDKIVDGEKLSFDFDLHYMTTQVTWRDQAQMIAEALYEAGVKCNITPLDFAVHYDRARNHKFDAMLAAWAGSSAPEDFTQIWHTESWASKGSNFTGFGDASTDALIDSIKYTIDTDLRHPMVKRLQEKVYDEQPYVFFFASTRRNVIHKRFGNADMYFERPGVIISNLRLLANGAISAPAAEAN